MFSLAMAPAPFCSSPPPTAKAFSILSTISTARAAIISTCQAAARSIRLPTKPSTRNMHVCPSGWLTGFQIRRSPHGRTSHDAARTQRFTKDDLTLVVPHQANLRIIRAMQERLGRRRSKSWSTSIATEIPLAAPFPLASVTPSGRQTKKR